ncbi:MAG TPA: GNAT family N-acetyltransferase [Promineifilum sp.]|uniref:GNAT family N-acetyltransferase n=1 Tax=Thauera sp. TaxID=1905334 RepID=UPI002CAB7118|nr:GNAT family N-acetyltransferase [Thauera sp.]HRP24306.1 GNAT family N-acetyltransferase [Thauera sp.]HRQ14136.1 GNAT family N-acetyltransferase [Promineifilum sp.]
MYIDICKKAVLEAKAAEIYQLFLESFGRPLCQKEWRWFYIDNPVGDPYVSLFYESEKLLGHYAVLPTLLRFRGESFVAYRSMTTMVHPEGRGRGLFTGLANRVYAMLQASGASMVYGFPNSNSAPGFSKNLGWTLLPPDQVYDISGDQILDTPALQEALLGSADIEWDSLSKGQARWRCGIPGFQVLTRPGFLAKPYQGVLNILHIERSGIQCIERDRMYRVMLAPGVCEGLPTRDSLFDYQFGYRVFDTKYRDASFRRELIMSDVF